MNYLKKIGKFGNGGFSPEQEKQKDYGEAKAIDSEYANWKKKTIWQKKKNTSTSLTQT